MVRKNLSIKDEDKLNQKTIKNNSKELENQIENDYSADNIIVLEGLEAVRKRPAMYIGSTGKRGWHHLVNEIIDNSIDEVLAGFANRIDLIIEPNNSIRIKDNGRGIPVEKHPVKKISTLEVIFTSLHSGGKFDHNSYKISGGLHGVGLAVVNACSEWVIVTIWRNGKKYQAKFGKGEIIESIMEVDNDQDVSETGTEVHFFPDKEIFKEINKLEDPNIFDYKLLSTILRNLAFLNPVTITITDKRGETKSDVFKFDGGISDFVSFLSKNKNTLLTDPIRFSKEKDGVIVDVAIQYNDKYNELIECFVNNINTIEGGTHLTGFKYALTRIFNTYIKDSKDFQFEKEKKLSSPDVREGLVAVLAIRAPEPQFEGQTKTKLGNPEVQGIVSEIVYSELSDYFDKNPKQIAPIIQKCLLAQHARIASQKARETIRRKNALEGLRLPGKLVNCISKDPSECELFIVEGNSAGGSAKQARSREFQAILPLRGKILNVEKASFGKIFENKEITSIIKAIGVGIQENGDDDSFDISKLRYDKIIIMCDADVDGAHIKTLILTFFFRYLRNLIDEGHVYIAVPPINKLSYKKKTLYLYDEKILTKEKKNFSALYNISDPSKIKVKRYKGLGEMNPEELWETTMDPHNRRLFQITNDDLIEANNIFSILMGDDVKSRRDYILDHYDEILNLDI